MTPRYLTIDDVVFLHNEGIRLYGGAYGVRDRHLLESAVGQTQQSFGGVPLYHSLAEIAVVYWSGLVLNHPFIDGNKRVGLRAADVFLKLNGIELVMTSDQAVKLTLDLITRVISRNDLINAVAEHSQPVVQ